RATHAGAVELFLHFGACRVAVVDVFHYDVDSSLLQVGFGGVAGLAPVGAVHNSGQTAARSRTGVGRSGTIGRGRGTRLSRRCARGQSFHTGLEPLGANLVPLGARHGFDAVGAIRSFLRQVRDVNPVFGAVFAAGVDDTHLLFASLRHLAGFLDHVEVTLLVDPGQ